MSSATGDHSGQPPIDGDPEALSRALDLLGDRWTLLIIQSVFLRVRRYGEILDRLHIAPSVLAERLQACVSADVLQREPYAAGGRTREEYRLTSRGQDLWMLLVCVWEWERTHVPGRSVELPQLMHLHCGKPTDPVFGCRRCPGYVRVQEVTALRQADVPVRSTTGRRSGRGQSGPPADPLLFSGESMSLLGDSRTTTMLVAAFLGRRRFSDFEQESGARPAMISNRLERLIDIGVLRRDIQKPREYRLTRKGHAFFPVLSILIDWTRRYVAEEDSKMVIKLRHKTCQELLEPVLRCENCQEVLRRYTVYFNLEADAPLQFGP